MNNWLKSPWFVTTIYSLCNGRGFDKMAQGKIPHCIINSNLLVRAKGAILSLSHVEVLGSYKRKLVDIEHWLFAHDQLIQLVFLFQKFNMFCL